MEARQVTWVRTNQNPPFFVLRLAPPHSFSLLHFDTKVPFYYYRRYYEQLCYMSKCRLKCYARHWEIAGNLLFFVSMHTARRSVVSVIRNRVLKMSTINFSLRYKTTYNFIEMNAVFVRSRRVRGLGIVAIAYRIASCIHRGLYSAQRP